MSSDASASQTGLSSATPIEPVPVSPVPASIPSAVERVAAALFKAEHPNAEWNGGRARAIWFSRAYAALEAMREPTRAMRDAGEHVLTVHSITSARFLYPWRAAIDAALAWPTEADVAQAIEARRAETQSGSVHESAVA